MTGHGGYQKPFTLAERKTIEKLLRQGKPGSEISKVIGRSKTGTNWEIRNHGGRENYCAKKANEMAIDAQKERIDKLRAKQTKKRPPNLSLRMDSLEMQINILKDTIKELLNDKENKRL